MNAQLAYDENAPTLETIPAPFSFHDISIVSDLAEMKAKMLADLSPCRKNEIALKFMIF